MSQSGLRVSNPNISKVGGGCSHHFWLPSVAKSHHIYFYLFLCLLFT